MARGGGGGQAQGGVWAIRAQADWPEGTGLPWGGHRAWGQRRSDGTGSPVVVVSFPSWLGPATEQGAEQGAGSCLGALCTLPLLDRTPGCS